MNRTRNFRIHWTATFLILVFLSLAWKNFAQEGFLRETVFVPMDDGVDLSTEVYLPANTRAPFPTILIRTPYGKHQHVYEGEFWATRGYAVVIQDTRGKWDSDGEYLPFFNEKIDGLETVDWITGQPWCNGEIGLWGSSYLAFCANVIATARYPAVKTMFVISGWLKGDKIISPGGSMHLMLNLAWILHEETQRVRSLKGYDMEELFGYLPLIDVFRSIGIESKIWNETVDIRTLNDTLHAHQISIPVFHMTGWNDFVCNAALDVYDQSLKSNPGEHKLLIGPWFHDQIWTSYTEVGDADFGPESAMGREKLAELALQWFDHILKKQDPEIEKEPDVSVFMMGANEWRSYDRWPPKSIRWQKWYLSSKTGANGSEGDGRLTLEKIPSPGSDTFVFDPMDPVPTYGGDNFHFFMHTLGIKDQAEIEQREDVLVYTSEALNDTMEIAGPLHVVFHASTSGQDTDFTAKFVELREDGYARIIQEGILRASYRNATDKRELLVPGNVYKLTIELGATAIAIPPGSKLRLEVSSSNFPKYDRNPNTGEEAVMAEILVPANQTVFFGKVYPSYILLPVINRENK